jgi:hypothetical protein
VTKIRFIPEVGENGLCQSRSAHLFLANFAKNHPLNTLVFFLYTAVVFFLLLKWERFRSEQLGGWAFLMVLGIKLVLALFFLSHPIGYLHDGPLFLGESKQLAGLAFTEPLTYLRFLTGIGETYDMILEYMKDSIYWDKPFGIYNDSKNLVRFNSVLQLLSLQNDRVNLLWVVVINMVGLQGIYRAITARTHSKKNLLFLLIFLLPSTTLWGLSILKETYLILGIGMMLEGLFHPSPIRHKQLKIALGIVLLLFFKPYILACMAAGALTYWLYLKLPKYKLALSGLGVFGLGILALLGTRGTSADVTEHISRKQFDFINLANGGIWIETDSCYIGFPMERLSSFNLKEENKTTFIQFRDTITGLIRTHGEPNQYVKFKPDSTYHYVIHFLEPSGSKIELHEISYSTSALVMNIPYALFNAFLRPLPGDPPAKIEKWYFIFENLLLLTLLGFALLRKKICSERDWAIVAGLLTFSLSLALLIGWTTPVLGAIIRYKLPITFAFILLSWLLLYPSTRAKT